MGREIVEAVPEAMQVFREGSEAAGIDLIKLCFDTPLSEMVETENQQPALVATSLAINEALRARGIVPDYVVGHSVGEFSALAAVRALLPTEAIALVRERGLAMAAAAKERPGSMAAILGLADEVVENICTKIHNVWPANYNCPGRWSSPARTVPSTRAARRPSRRERAARSGCACRARSTVRSSSAPPSGCVRRSSACTSRSRSRRSCPR